MTAFFVPPVPLWEGASDEEVYAELAKFAGFAVPPLERRIAKIEFVHDSYTWTAEVGRTLRGERRVTRIRNKQKKELTERTSDPATVLAIFASVPHFVVTDQGFTEIRGKWVNPFMATATSVSYFE
jgi:hypothetical protein